MSNGVVTMQAVKVPLCVQAYATAKGMDVSIRALLSTLSAEDTSHHGLVDVGDGVYVSPMDTRVGLQALASEHSSAATLLEVYQSGTVPRCGVADDGDGGTFAGGDEDEEDDFDDDDDDDDDDYFDDEDDDFDDEDDDDFDDDEDDEDDLDEDDDA